MCTLLGRFILSYAVTVLLMVAYEAAAQSTQYLMSDFVDEPYVCWTTVMEFYDSQAYPYFSRDGYYFDANPFRLTRWMDGNTGGIFHSTKGVNLVDVTGRYIWMDARIRVNCYVRRYLFGAYNVPYALVTMELGQVVLKSIACNGEGGDPNTGVLLNVNPASPAYDPYDSGGTTSGDCPGGGGGGAGGGFEYICVDVWVSGEGWQEVWCGWVPVTD